MIGVARDERVDDGQEAAHHGSGIAAAVGDLQRCRGSGGGEGTEGDAGAGQVAVGLGLDRHAEPGGDEAEQGLPRGPRT